MAKTKPESPPEVDIADLPNLDVDEFDTDKWQTAVERMTIEQAVTLAQERGYQKSLDRISALRGELKRRFANRNEMIDALFAAAVAQVPAVLIGPPGVAKGNV